MKRNSLFSRLALGALVVMAVGVLMGATSLERTKLEHATQSTTGDSLIVAADVMTLFNIPSNGSGFVVEASVATDSATVTLHVSPNEVEWQLVDFDTVPGGTANVSGVYGTQYNGMTGRVTLDNLEASISDSGFVWVRMYD